MEVAAAHAAYLNTPFKSAAGTRLLKLRYEAISAQAGATGYVARLESGFAGYACGVWDRKSLRLALLKQLRGLVLHGFSHILSNPGFILQAGVGFFNDPAKTFSPEGYELRPLVVLPSFRGRGVADRLVETLFEDAKSRGFTQVFLFTERENLAAIKFYTRFGFALSAILGRDGTDQIVRFQIQI